MRISDWSSDVCSSDLPDDRRCRLPHQGGQHPSDLRHGDLTASERGQAFGFHARPRSGHREEVLPDPRPRFRFASLVRTVAGGEGSMDERLPQYLHKPVQILWFRSDEFVLVVTTIFVAVIVGGLVGWAFIAALLLFLPWKRAQPRGFLAHLAWPWGMLHFRHYPGDRKRTHLNSSH